MKLYFHCQAEIANQKWHEHDARKTDQMRELQERLQQAESQTASGGSTSLSGQQQMEFDRLLMVQKRKTEQIEQERIKVQERTVLFY